MSRLSNNLVNISSLRVILLGRKDSIICVESHKEAESQGNLLSPYSNIYDSVTIWVTWVDSSQHYSKFDAQGHLTFPSPYSSHGSVSR